MPLSRIKIDPYAQPSCLLIAGPKLDLPRQYADLKAEYGVDA